MKLDPQIIRTDGGTQPRAALSPEVMDDYAEQMREGDNFPQVTVFFDGTDYWLSDGFHRLGAHLRAHAAEPIEAEVIQGTKLDAQWHSLSVNRAHGLRRTKEDRIRAVKAALQHPKGMDRSDRDIAEYIGVSPSTVGKYREDLKLQSGVQLGHLAGKAEKHDRKGRDGKTYRVRTGKKKGSKSKRRKIATPRTPAEFIKARKNGYTGHPPSLVKLELPNNNFHNCAYDLLQHFKFEYLEKVFKAVVEIHQSQMQKEKR